MMVTFISKLLISISIVISTVAASDFAVNTAGYIGGSSSDDAINAVDVTSNGIIVLGGKLPDYAPSGITPVELLGGGDGAIIRMSTDGAAVLSLTRFGGCVYDLEIGSDGRIAVCGDFGTGVLLPDASDFAWVKTDIEKGTLDAHTGSFFGDFASSSVNMRYRRELSRVSIGVDGTVASMQQPLKYYDSQGNIRSAPYCWIYIYDSAGDLLGSFTADDKYSEDICVDGANNLVIHAGWNPKHHDWGSVQDHPIHVPFMRAHSYTGQVQWANYDWEALDCYQQTHFADSRVSEVVIGADGSLYMAGYIHGGDHLWKLGPKDITDRPNVHIGYDNYTNPVNMGAGIDHAYFCQYDPRDGDILKGQAAIVREHADGSGKPRQSQIKGIDVASDGTVYLAGYCQKYLPGRSSATVNGISVGSVISSLPAAEPFVLVVNPGWQSRKAWVSFSKSSCEGTLWGIGCNNGYVAAAGTVFGGEAITSQAMQSAASSAHEGYIVAWEDHEHTAAQSGVTSSLSRASAASEIRIYDTAGRLLSKTGRAGFPNGSVSGIVFLCKGFHPISVKSLIR
ncbi:MAG: hypothetical protein GF398_08715 [Chitinivibrionales bacterium]|nr:hypothetical protein [Chitinivibrionales bacterium]